MKLLYIWVEKFRILKDIELSFDGEYAIHYDVDEALLTCQSNKNYCCNLFSSKSGINESSKITVTGIVGNNGSGKTTIAELVNICCNRWEDGKYIIVWSDEKIFGRCNGVNVKKVIGTEINLVTDTPDFNTVYYSAYYHPLHKSSYLNHDISTSRLIVEEEELFLNSNRADRNYRNPIAAHNSMELIRNCDFFASYHSGAMGIVDWGIPIPLGCIVTFNDTDFNLFKDEMILREKKEKTHVLNDLIVLTGVLSL